MRLDLEALVIESQIETGANPVAMMARAKGAGDAKKIARLSSVVTTKKQRRNPPWTDKELDFVRDSLGYLSMEEIGAKIGRSANAIKVLWTRRGFEAPSKRANEMVATVVGIQLGMCGKKIIRLIDEGRMPGRRVAGVRNIHVVNKKELLHWLCRPMNWIYVRDVERIQNPHWKSLVKRKMTLWGDAWWTTGQVGVYHGVAHTLVNKHVRMGWLPGVRWQNWLILRSDAIKHTFHTGKGKNFMIDWKAEAEAFMILARAVGYSSPMIDSLCKYPNGRTDFRVRYLRNQNRIPYYIKQFNLPIQYDPSDGRFWADWRDCTQPFPQLNGAITRFLQQRPLRQTDQVRGVLQSWAQWFAQDDDTRVMAQKLKFNANRNHANLWGIYQSLVEKGIDPFEENR